MFNKKGRFNNPSVLHSQSTSPRAYITSANKTKARSINLAVDRRLSGYRKKGGLDTLRLQKHQENKVILTVEDGVTMPPLCKGRWHRKVTEGL